MQTFPIDKWYIQGPDFISLDKDNLKEQLLFAKANNVDGFVISYDQTKECFSDLNFLLDINVRGIVISFDAVKDASAINKFRGLEVLKFGWMNYSTSEIDLSNFERLRVLDINWNKYITNLDKATNVIRLNIWGYKPKSRNLEVLRDYNNLVYLTLVQPGVNNLDGIENLKLIKEADFGNVRSLTTFFSNEKEVTFPLEELTFSLCPNFDIDTIPAISTLKHLGLSQLGKRQTLKNLLNKLPNLESLGYTQSELIDGNLDYFLSHRTLKQVTIDYKKHYNLKEKEIQKRLDLNRTATN